MIYSSQQKSANSNKITLLFIDTKVEACHSFIRGIKSGVEPFLLHQQEDGIKQITEVISRYKNVDSIHIVSHGDPGTLYLGNNKLSIDTLKNYAGELQTWFNSISDDITPALVLYGCNVAAGDAGSEFLEKLHQLTQATVYASKTLVGNSHRGGSWNLEASSGKVQDSLSLAFKPQVLETYSGVLATGTDGNYTFYDSQEGNKGTVAFTDITGSSNNIGKTELDWQEKDIYLGFQFTFYDQIFDKITVLDNGYMTFVSTNPVNSQNGNLPRNGQTYSIFPYWDNFEAKEVFYKQENNRFIVQWNKVKHSDNDENSPENATFQVILYKDSNNIEFVYKDVDLGNDELNNGASATIGINKNDQVALKYLYDGTASPGNPRTLAGVTSIRFVTEPKLVNSKITLKENDSTLPGTEKIITLTQDNFLAQDVDNTSTPANIKFQIANLQYGEFWLNGNSVTEFTQNDINNGKVTFIHNRGENPPSFDVVVTDGYNSTSPKSVNINSGISFSNINDTPQLSGLASEVTLLENTLNQAADTIYKNSTITLTDDDSSQFNGGNLTVAYNGTSEVTDKLAIGSNANISLSGNIVKYNGTDIGTIDGTKNGSNGKDLVVNFINTNATLAAVKALIASLTYQTTSDTPKASRTITVTVNDNGSPNDPTPKTSTAVTTEIKVTAENDSPVNSIPQPITIDEDTPFTFSNNQISLSDPDAGNVPVQLKLTANNGTLKFNGNTTGLTFSDDNGTDGTLQLTGSIADINSALNGLTFTPNADFNNNLGSAYLKIQTDDTGINQGIGGNLIDDNDTIQISVTPVNDAPVNTVPNSQVVNEDTEINITGLSIKDVDVNENGSSNLQVTLAVTKGLLKLQSTSGITFANGNNNGNAAISFTGTLDAINAVLAAGVIYQGSQNFNGNDILTITTNDLGNTGKSTPLQDVDTVAITVNVVNDTPVNTFPGAQQAVDEDTQLIFNAANNNRLSISDVDFDPNINNQPFINQVKVTLQVSKGTLKLGSIANNLAVENNETATVTITGAVADINNALDNLIYQGIVNYNGLDTLTITTNDLGHSGSGGVKEKVDTVAIKINPINDPPVNADVPTRQTIDEDTELVFNVANNNFISISDIDVDNELNFQPVDEVQVTLSVNRGKLTLSTTTNLIVEKNQTANVIVKGKVADINIALSGLRYLGNDNYNGEDTLKIEINDLNNGSVLGERFATAEVPIAVNAVNDIPVNNLPTTVEVNEDENLIFSSINGNAISIKDVDVLPDINIQPFIDRQLVTLTVTKGKLTLGSTANLSELTGNGTNTISFKGTVADINQGLEGLNYLANVNYNGDDTLTITTNDLGNSGKGEALQDTDSIAIKVKPVNDAPINSVPQAQEVDEDEKLFFNNKNANVLSLSDVDVDEGTGEVKVTLAVNNGTLTLGKQDGLTFGTGDGVADATMTFTGKVANVNQALQGMFYLGNKDFHGAETLTFTTDDLSNFGKVTQIDQDTINITVIPDPDADGINNPTEIKVAKDLKQLFPTNVLIQSLSDRAVNNADIVALFGINHTTQPIIIAIKDEDQKELSGESKNPGLVIHHVETENLKETINDPLAAFDSKDLKKSALKGIAPILDVLNFEVKPEPEFIDVALQKQIADKLKQKPIRIEVKLPDSETDTAVSTILLRRADGTLVDFRRQLNPLFGKIDEELLTGVILQDRNLNGKADWAVISLQDGEWGDLDDAANGTISQSLVAVNWNLSTSRLEVRSSQDGLNFYGNRSHVQFTLNRFRGDNASEIGMARVRFGNDGQIVEVNGKVVNSLDEAKQVIIQRGETLFSSLKDKRNPNFGAQNCTVAFEQGEQAVFFVIQGGTKDELLFNGLNSKPVQFSLSSLNGGTTIFQASGDASGQTANFSLAGLFDINAKILTPEQVKAQLGILAVDSSQFIVNRASELIDLNSSAAFDNQQVTLKFSLQREATNNNSVYFYRVDDTQGSIKDPLTGMLIDPTSQLSAEQQKRYLQLATSDRLVQGVQFQTGNFTNTEASVTLNGGAYYLPFMVANGTLSEIGNDFSRVLTSYMSINSDRVDHVRSLGNGMFGFEDIIGGGDFDYNDMILSITQVQAV
ncbi:DUF4347 domain-containing protein [Tolypothrix sp. FACHB-123]|uniref:DUF4347 domain-containing protein n=1 Tax=Tolypothrix sp. FACHB-123 TaxID=2692868 RepID=UPI0016869AD8|nr:DUF4347 domain-containing protein [Tolypothrix sp. FACHB-123]MBD2359125.1 DUF4347 domain-containing protein [Tolypothrix sp. FACHB-123]